jgi:hypothetical protein
LNFLIGLIFFTSTHPLHVSVTEIEYDQKQKSLKIMMRIFADDLETTFREQFKESELDIMEADEKHVDEMAATYIKQHFRISLDEKTQPLNYLGHEQENDAFIFYIEVTNVKKWKTITAFNDGFTEMFDDQSNLVHVTANEVVKSLRLTRDTPAGKITFTN